MARKQWVMSLLARLTANAPAQALLQRGVVFAHRLMGIGSGASVAWSGEKYLWRQIERARREATAPLCVFDVGAGSGEFLAGLHAPMSTSAAALEVHAFEPSRQAFERLVRAFGSTAGLHLNNVAMSDEPGAVELFADSAGSPLGSLYRRRLSHLGTDPNHSERVRAQRLDDYCIEHGVQRIDLLKLDVEGHELRVLQGARSMLRDNRIDVIAFEFGGANIDSKTFFQDFWYFFRENGGGRLHRMTPLGGLVPIPEYGEVHEQFRTTIMIVLPADSASAGDHGRISFKN